MDKKILYDLSYPWLDSGDAKDITCCICSGKYKQKPVVSFLLNGEKFEIRKCEKDKLMYLHPQPEKNYRRQLYNHPSYFKGTDDMYGLFINNQKAKKIAKIRIKEILKHVGERSSLLELGCAYGHLLEEAKRKGFKKVLGIEVSKNAIDICRKKGIDVIQADINRLKDLKISSFYSVIAAYSIIEHLENPYAFFKNIKKVMEPDGILIFRVPETDLKTGPRLSFLDHFWHFTKFSIRKILSDNNFKIKEIFPSGKFKGIRHKGTVRSITIVATPDCKEK